MLILTKKWKDPKVIHSFIIPPMRSGCLRGMEAGEIIYYSIFFSPLYLQKILEWLLIKNKGGKWSGVHIAQFENHGIF